MNSITYIPYWSLCSRIISEFALRPFFPRNYIDKTNSLEKAVRAAEEGKGLVIVFAHFSFRDAMEVSRSIIYKNPILKRREVVNPFAYHQYNKFLGLLGKLYHGKFYRIVNNSTLMKKGYEHLPKGKGLGEFIAASSEALSTGGIVTLAINASRKERLDLTDPQKPIGYLIASLQARGIKEYGVLLVAFSIKNAKSYAKKEVGGMNVGKTYTIHIGKYYKLAELLAQPDVNGKVSQVDAFVRRKMVKIVPKEYL